MTKEQITVDIIQYAQAGKHIEFNLISSHLKLRQMRARRKYLGLVLTCLTNSKRKVFRSYCEDIVNYKTDPGKLLAFTEIAKLEQFYLFEYEIIDNMILEYKAYLAAGNYLNSLLGKERASESMRDHRNYRG